MNPKEIEWKKAKLISIFKSRHENRQAEATDALGSSGFVSPKPAKRKFRLKEPPSLEELIQDMKLVSRLREPC